MIEDYLLSLDVKWMQDCILIEDAGLCLLAIARDRLRWDCFLEGRIALESGSSLSPLFFKEQGFT
jgi:hypothetical protein